MARGDRITGVPTGFARYDTLTSGLHEGDLSIIAARPGMGKTSFVLNIAANVASPKNRELDGDPNQRWEEAGVSGVVVFSLEMPREQLANRMVCSEARVDVSKMRTGYLSPQDWSKLTQAASFLGSLPIWIDDSPGLSIIELRAKVRRLQAEYDLRDDEGRKTRKIGAVIIDYLQLMKGRDGAASREQEISEISRGLKGLAKELEVPVIALSQLNRAVETRKREVEAAAHQRPSRVGRHRAGRRQHRLHLPRRLLQPRRLGRAEHRGADHRQAAKRPDRYGQGALRQAVDALRQPGGRRIRGRARVRRPGETGPDDAVT